MGTGSPIRRDHSRGGTVRLCRVVAGGIQERHLFAGELSECAPVSTAVQRPPDRLSCLRFRCQRKRPVRSATVVAAPWGSGRLCALRPSAGRTRSEQLLCSGRRCASVSAAPGGRSRMTFQVIRQPRGDARSPFHIVETATGREVEWANRFLDRGNARCLAETTLRAYAMDLLHFIRWWSSALQTDTVAEQAVASALPAY